MSALIKTFVCIVMTLVLAAAVLLRLEIWRDYTTDANEEKLLPYEDGSQVWIGEKTKLRIFRRPGWERRIVFFDGTVLLDAARNGLPFRIFADKATLTLQNARFEMCRWDNGTITLHVLKGPVMLTGPVPGRADETLKMTLRDNDSVTFRTEGEHLIIT